MEAGTLNWTLPPALAELGSLPIRLLTEDGRVQAQGLSGCDLQVPPGRYYLACSLPNGREIVRRKPIDIEAGARIDPVFPFLDFDLAAADAAVPQPAQYAAAAAGGAAGSFSVLGYVAGLFKGLRGGNLPAAAPSRGRVHLCEGDWMAQPDRPNGPPAGAFSTTRLFPERGPIPLSRPIQSRADRLIEIVDAGVRRFYVVPFDWAIGSAAEPAIQAELSSTDSGTRPHFTSPLSAEANGFIEFVNNGLLDQARALGSDFLDRSDEAMREGKASALKAVLAAYVLLRANALEGIEARVTRLAAMLPWVPDVLVIQAEALSRLGKHDEAVAALRRALQAGCPWFRSGVSYMLERLRLYVEVDAEESASFTLGSDDGRLFRERRDHLEAMSRKLDTGSLFAAFTYPADAPDQAPDAATA